MKLFLLKKDRSEFSQAIAKAGVDKYCIDLLDKKTRTHVFLLKDARIEQANILKQTALSVGCDAAVHRDVLSGTKKISDCIIMCNESQLEKIAFKLKEQPFSLGKISSRMIDMLKQRNIWMIRGDNVFNERDYLIMGILNVTPDSFYDGGAHSTMSSALKCSERMIEDGADIIDIGGESTRPYSEPVSIEAEMQRVIPVIRALRKIDRNILISVDTTKSQIAEAAADEGADIVNDISGFTYDSNMLRTIRSKGVSAIAMHIRGTPGDMQNEPVYDELMSEITDFLEASIESAVNTGIERERLVIDPGIGFGKTPEHNLIIINSIDTLSSLNRPVLIGASNKSFIGKCLNADIDDRLDGTVAANVWAYSKGASVFRVHEVASNRKALEMARRLKHV